MSDYLDSLEEAHYLSVVDAIATAVTVSIMMILGNFHHGLMLLKRLAPLGSFIITRLSNRTGQESGSASLNRLAIGALFDCGHHLFK